MIWIKQKDDWDIGNLMSFISKMKIIKKKGFRRIMFNINTSLSPTAAWELLKEILKIILSILQMSIKVRIETIEHETNEIEKERAGNFNHRQLKTLEADLDTIYDKKS